MPKDVPFKKTENKEIERSLLFAIFKYDKYTLEIIRGIVTVEDFVFPIYRKIYHVLCSEFDKTGSIISYKAFFNFVIGLADTTEDDRIQYKVAMQEINTAVIKDEDVIAYSQQLKELSINRKLLYAMSKVADKLDEGDSSKAIELAEMEIEAIKKGIIKQQYECIALKGDIEKRIQYLKDIKEHPEKAGVVWTGFRNIDNFNPPLKPGDLAWFQARTNIGKSMFLKGVALANYCGVYSKAFHTPSMEGKIKGSKVIVITIEMNAMDYVFRMDSQITKMQHTEDFCFAKVVNEESKINEWSKKIQSFGNNDTDLLIYWVPEKCTPAAIDQIISNNPFKPNLVVIDYIGDMDCGEKGLTNYDWKAQALLYTRLKQIAGKHECVIFSAQQTVRGAKEISTETGAGSDKASSLASLVIAIEQSDIDKLWNGVDSRGQSVLGRITLREVKRRSGTKLLTHIIPEFDIMHWFENPSEKPMIAADYRVEEQTNTKKSKEPETTNDVKEKQNDNAKLTISASDLDEVEVPLTSDADLEAALSEI